MGKYEVHNVFTPTKPAVLTFVERDEINNKLVQSLRTPGKQLVVYGHSGSGKTTLLINKLYQLYEGHITTRCMSSLTFEQLILDAFDQLNPYYDAEYIKKEKRQVNSGIQAEYFGIKSQIGASISDEIEKKKLRVLPPQLTVQRLARFVGSAKCCWVLEDFHKVAESEKVKLSEAMKIFMDMAVEFPDIKTIAIGAVGTAREVVACEPNMRRRVAEIHVPLMDDVEIRQILTKGEVLMNITIPNGMKDDIVRYSNGLAAVCHQLALNSCDARGLAVTSDSPINIDSQDFEKALSDYVADESDSIKEVFDKALLQKRKRKYDNCRLILEALALSDTEGGLTKGDLVRHIREKIPQYPAANLTLYLEQLQIEDRGTILRFDSASERYDFANPFHKVFARIVFSRSQRKPKQLDFQFPSMTLSPDGVKKILELLEQTARLVSVVAR